MYELSGVVTYSFGPVRVLAQHNVLAGVSARRILKVTTALRDRIREQIEDDNDTEAAKP